MFKRVALVLAIVAALVGFLLFFGPGAWWLDRAAVTRLDNFPDKQLAAVDAARGRILQLGAGLVAALTLGFTALSYRLSVKTHVACLYNKALEQLRAATDSEQVAGAHTLERIMHDSPEYHIVIVGVLTTFVRDHAGPSQGKGRGSTNGTTTERHRPDDKATSQLPKERPPAGVQAALTVLGRRPRRAEPDRLRLADTSLRGALLRNARLQRGENLLGAMLRRARVQGANPPHGVNLRRADLTDAHLEGAHLEGASLREAMLVGADLEGAHMRGASLAEADLSNREGHAAKLGGADLRGADLKDAILQGADLAGAYLAGAHLSGVVGNPQLTDEQRHQAHCRPLETCSVRG